MMKNKTFRMNTVIKIYRTDVERMKSQIKNRMYDIGDIYNYHADFEESLDDGLWEFYLLAKDAWAEACRTSYFCEKADAMLADESFDFIWVDADEWFAEWDIEELIENGLIDKYYMLPNSDEVDEIFDAMKAEYKYIVTDVFRFFRFYPLNEDVVIA